MGKFHKLVLNFDDWPFWKCIQYILVNAHVKTFVTTLPGHSWHQILRSLAICFTFTGGTSCSKYLYSKYKIKHFWVNVTRKVWHFNYWKWEIISFITKLNITFFMHNFDSHSKKLSFRIICSPFWAQAQANKFLYNFFQIFLHHYWQ